MSNLTSRVMIQAYEQDIEPTLFLSGMFQSPRRNFHNVEEIEIDITRGEEDIAIAIQDLSTGPRLNSSDVYTNKAFKPPILKEAGPINAHNLIKRMAGQDPFQAVDFQANAIAQGVRLGRKLNRKIARAIEYQSAQVFITGVVTLIDSTGAAVYSIDYKPKASHFPNAGIAWSAANATKMADIAALANIIRGDGLASPDFLGFGAGSFELFIKDQEVRDRMDNRRIAGSGVVPLERLGNGGIYRGTIEIENYRYDMYTYDGRYKHPQTGVSTAYIPDGKVIVKASTGRMDATFGGIPRIGSPDPRIPSALTSRVSIPGQMMDVQMNAWITPDGETMMIQSGTRPLMIPVAIDTYGCLDTGI